MSKCFINKTSLVESDGDLQPNSYYLEKFAVYETQARFYLVGRDKSRARWRVLKIDRTEPSMLSIYEDPAIYTQQDCDDLLRRLAEGNRSCGGVNFVTKAYGIVGFIRFLDPYYMILITKRRFIGNIHGHAIYGIGESILLTVPHPSVLTDLSRIKAENRYKQLFTSIDLTKDFFYSYNYRIMWSLQKNATSSCLERMPYEDMFVWNSFLTREIQCQVKSSLWTVALVHGFFKQVKLSFKTANFALTLIARRSRHFAGTRYLRRGINEAGQVANDVETEQLVHDEEPSGKLGQVSSIVQHRGSIPLFWSQETSIFSPKPDILLYKNDQSYCATRIHFENLAARYGNPIIVLNLVKTVEKRPRETILCREFANSVAYLNHTLPKASRIKFVQWDFHMFARRKSINVLEVLNTIALDVLEKTGLYYSGKPNGASHESHTINVTKNIETHCEPEKIGQQPNNRQYSGPTFQQGVLRSNCIDCLDRTNVAQYAFGLAALGHQMCALGLCDIPRVGSHSTLAVTLMEMYENMGDVLAIQYGGSAAHNKVFSQRQGKWNATIQSLEFFRSIRRHYNNAYLDGGKQDAINIFLGNFCPRIGKHELCKQGSDNHLQVGRCGDADLNGLRFSIKRSLSAGNMIEENGKAIMLTERTQVNDTNVNKPTPQHGLVRRAATTNEEEMKNDFVEVYEDYLETRNEDGYPFIQHGNKTSDTRYLGDCAETDWLSSSGNSCEEDAQERHSVTVTDAENMQNSGYLLPCTIHESEADETNEYYQDLTNALLANTGDWSHNRIGRSEDMDTFDFLQEHDVGSGITRIRGGAASLGVFSKSFVDWIHKGQTLCY